MTSSPAKHRSILARASNIEGTQRVRLRLPTRSRGLLLSPFKRPVTWRNARKHAYEQLFSTLRNNFDPQPYAVEPREVVLERAAHRGEYCTAVDTTYS